MKLVIIGKPACPGCIQAKNVLESKGIKYEYVDAIAANMDIEMLSSLTGLPARSMSFPMVVLDGTYVGGGEQGVGYLRTL